MNVQYRNHQENVDHYTRTVCDLVSIHPTDELNEKIGKSGINTQQGMQGDECLKFFIWRV